MIKDVRAQGVFAFVTLRPDIDRSAVEAWLRNKVDPLVRGLREQVDSDGRRVATVAVGFGPSFFSRAGGFQPVIAAPAGFASLPPVPAGTQQTADIVFYLMSTSEAVAAGFLSAIWACRPDVTTIRVERGYQRIDGTEPFGYADGVRNVPRNLRGQVVFVDREQLPEEPDWTENGTYLVHMRIGQNLDAFNALSPEEQDAIMGRKRSGRRLDLDESVPVASEPEMQPEGPPPLASHVRKAGPRGQVRDTTMIFRRGLPFLEAGSDGTLRAGLQFASFQASLDQFRVIFNRWMLNPSFPAGAGRADELFARGLVTVESFGFYFVPGDTDDFIGSQMFEPARRRRKPKTGRVAVRKKVLDTSGAEAEVDLAGFSFQVVDQQGQPHGAVITTNSAGHALSDALPVDVDLILQELPPPPPLQPSAPISFRLHSARHVQLVENRIPPGSIYNP